MLRLLRFLLHLLGFASLAIAHEAGAPCLKKVSVTRDEFGNRPGARGFSTVILDAGHGGTDSGAQSRFISQPEKDLTLDMVKRIRTELARSVKCVLVRDRDWTCDLDWRVNLV